MFTNDYKTLKLLDQTHRAELRQLYHPETERTPSIERPAAQGKSLRKLKFMVITLLTIAIRR